MPLRSRPGSGVGADGGGHCRVLAEMSISVADLTRMAADLHDQVGEFTY